jgi:hypothetical protein
MNWQSVLILCHFVGTCLSQTSQPLLTFGFNPTSCPIPGQVESFSACNSLASSAQSCSSVNVASGISAFKKCFCQQGFFNNIYESGVLLQLQLSTDAPSCGSEQRLCDGNGNLDNNLESGADSWISFCTPEITYSLTTPAVVFITVPFDPRCGALGETACNLASQGLVSCESLNNEPMSLSACICQESLLENAFTCEYVGAVTCQQSQFDTTNLLGAGVCSTFPQFFSSMTSKVYLTIQLLALITNRLVSQESAYYSSLTATGDVGVQSGTASAPGPNLPPSATSTSKTSGASRRSGGDGRGSLVSTVVMLAGVHFLCML